MSKITLDNGRSVEIQDEATAALVSDHIERLQKQITDASAELERRQAVIDGHAEQIAALKTQTSDEAVSARVAAVLDAQTRAAKIAPGTTFDGVDPLAIQRAALAKAKPTVDWAGKTDAYVQAAFDLAAEQIDTTDAHAEQKRKLAADGAKAVNDDAKVPAYDSYAARFTQAKE